jgi:hypothetical protein
LCSQFQVKQNEKSKDHFSRSYFTLVDVSRVHCISIFLLQYAIINLLLSVFLFYLYTDLLWCSVNGKAKGEKCKLQKPCGMENCYAQCKGLCDASGFYSAYCDPPNGVCQCLNLRTGVFNSLS